MDDQVQYLIKELTKNQLALIELMECNSFYKVLYKDEGKSYLEQKLRNIFYEQCGNYLIYRLRNIRDN